MLLLQDRVKCDISIGVEGGLVAANMTKKFMASNREFQTNLFVIAILKHTCQVF